VTSPKDPTNTGSGEDSGLAHAGSDFRSDISATDVTPQLIRAWTDMFVVLRQTKEMNTDQTIRRTNESFKAMLKALQEQRKG